MPVRKCSTCNKTELMATKDDILKARPQPQQAAATEATTQQPQPPAASEAGEQPAPSTQPSVATEAATSPAQSPTGEATAQPQQAGIAAGKTLQSGTDTAREHLNEAYTQIAQNNEKESKERAVTKQKEAEDREQKRYRTKAILAALGDGISSLANLYYTTRGAQGIPQPAASLSEVTKRRFDEAKRRKEKMEDEYRAALIRAGFADRAEAFQAARDDKNNAAADRRAEAARRADAEERQREREWNAVENEKERAYRLSENEKERQARKAAQDADRKSRERVAYSKNYADRGSSGGSKEQPSKLTDEENALYDLAVSYGLATPEGEMYSSKVSHSSSTKNGVTSKDRTDTLVPYYRNEVSPGEQQRALRIGNTIQQLLNMGWSKGEIETVKADIEKGLSAREIAGTTYRFLPYDLPDVAKERKYEQYDMDDNNYEQYQVKK